MRRDPMCVDRNSSAIYPARAYLAGATKRELWVSIQSLPWLVGYAAEQVRLQGVVGTAVADWECEHMPPNCSQVPNLRIDWNFTTKQWDGKFLDGPCKGVTQSISPRDHTEQSWCYLRHKNMVPEIPLSGAPRNVLRDAARKLLIAWCAAAVEGTQHELDVMWGFESAVAAE